MRKRYLQERPSWKMELERRLSEYRQRKTALKAAQALKAAAIDPAKAA